MSLQLPPAHPLAPAEAAAVGAAAGINTSLGPAASSSCWMRSRRLRKVRHLSQTCGYVVLIVMCIGPACASCAAHCSCILMITQLVSQLEQWVDALGA
jgi:hypothetical protein